MAGLKTFSDNYNSPESFRDGVEIRDKVYPADSVDTESLLLPLLTRDYNTPDKFRLGVETKDFSSTGNRLHHRNNKPLPQNTEQQQEAKLLFERLSDKLIIDDGQGEGGDEDGGEESEKEKSQLNRAYTEGGLVILPQKQSGGYQTSQMQ